MADLVKKIKIKKQDGTFTDYIPIGAEAQNVSTSDGDSVQLKLNKKPYYYNSVADMKADTKLKTGDMAVTLGYYESNDGGGAEYNITNATESYFESINNNLKAELIIKNNEVNVKQFGAYGDGVHDDTNYINQAILSKAYKIIMNSDSLITNTINLTNFNTNKTLDFTGSLIITDNFTGTKVVDIYNISNALLTIENIYIINEKFYKKDRHGVTNTVRTTFDGVVIRGNSRRVLINNISVVGISSRALVIGEHYETTINRAELWGSNLTDENCIDTNQTDNLQSNSQNTRYTYGLVCNGHDNILNNIVVVGFNVGMVLGSANMINNYHCWAYYSSMFYGIMTQGRINHVNNIYLDTIKGIADRQGAGIYEVKSTDGVSTTLTSEYNIYSNISTLAFENAVVCELGDDAREQISYGCTVSGVHQGISYKVFGSAVGSPQLENLYGGSSRTMHWIYNPKIDNTQTTLKNALVKLLNTYFYYSTNAENNGAGCTSISGICFVTNKMNKYLPNTMSSTTDPIVWEVKAMNTNIYEINVYQYGWPRKQGLKYIFYRNGKTSGDLFTVPEHHFEIFPDYLPSASDFVNGATIIYNNKPLWKTSAGWVDATGTVVTS